MKKKLCAILMCCVMIAAMLPVTAFAEDTGVAIDETNFPDANFRKVVSRFDTNSDGVLSAAEIGSVTSINCSSENISDLKGIEYFTALTSLYCVRNQLTALDVSKNTALTYLYCGENQLTALDISSNTALASLSCDWNQLTALDVRNTELTELNCYGNEYMVFVSEDGTFDLSTLPGSFDMSKASDWVGGTVKGNILKVDNGVSKVTYKYDCGRRKTETFTLVLAQISGDVNGDGILDAKVPYDNDESKAQTMMHHLKQSFYHVAENVGPHGLPLAMRADWNDCINLSCFSSEPGESFQTSTSPKYGEDKYSKTAESVMVAALFTYSGPNYVDLCRHMGDEAEAQKAQAEIDKMKKNIMDYGFDGEWFLRAYDDFGKKMGSKECEEGKIFIEPQGFAVMGGVGKETGADLKALESVDKYLNSEHGLVLNNPAFTKYYIEYGEISTYPAGYKENAGIFCHNNAWIICAEAFVGHGDKAFEYYSKIAPAYREEKYSDLHRTEPYVYAQMIAGKDAKRHGEAKNSWLTGTAAWNFVAVSQYILGIIPDWDGLKVDPSIPSAWDGFKVVRQFRGASYSITFKNPDHVCKGVKSVTVDGKAIEGNVLPVFGDGKTHEVEVIMG